VKQVEQHRVIANPDFLGKPVVFRFSRIAPPAQDKKQCLRLSEFGINKM